MPADRDRTGTAREKGLLTARVLGLAGLAGILATLVQFGLELWSRL